MDKQQILEEIKRTAAANGGRPLGQVKCFQQTGIRTADWFGKYAARWGDLVREAGFVPNVLNASFEEDVLIEKYIQVMREFDRFPVQAELKLKRRNDPGFPSPNVFARFGPKAHLVARILTYCEGRADYDDVTALCEAFPRPRRASTESGSPAKVPTSDSDSPTTRGYVYLIADPRGHRIGQTARAVGSRLAEHENQQGEAELLHRIVTDDPRGVERYWLQRFADKRAGPSDHFKLSSSDIQAFKRWKKIY